MADAEENSRNDSQIIQSVFKASHCPSGENYSAGKILLDCRAEFDQGEYKKKSVDPIQQDRPGRQEFFDQATPFKGQKTDGSQHDHHSDYVGNPEVVLEESAGRRADDSQHQEQQGKIDDLKQKPEGAEEFHEE